MSIFRKRSILACNYVTQWRNPDVKVFFVGFNKCATTAIHKLMVSSGIRSVHWEARRGNNLALEMEEAIKENCLRNYCRKFTAFSDIFYFASDKILEGNRYFREFHRVFPNAYFILNDRNVDAWINSRALHRKGDLLRRFREFYNTDDETVKCIWRNDHATHVKEVLDHFAGHDRFLHFHIDQDSPSTIASFLAPTFRIEADKWTTINATKSSASRNEFCRNSAA